MRAGLAACLVWGGLAVACRVPTQHGTATAESAVPAVAALRRVHLTVLGVPLEPYTLTVAQEHGREVRLAGTASGEFVLELAPGPSVARLQFAARRCEWVFSVGSAAVQELVWHLD